MASVEHFEIPADDIARASAFYRAVFDFDYEPWGEEMGMLRTGRGTGAGGVAGVADPRHDRRAERAVARAVAVDDRPHGADEAGRRGHAAPARRLGAVEARCRSGAVPGRGVVTGGS